MRTDPAIHPHQVLTTSTGQQVPIDREMTPIIRSLWRLGFTTSACCQNVGEATAGVRAQRPTPLGYGGDPFIDYHRGWALLKLPTPDAHRLVDMLAKLPPFSDRVRTTWQPGSWRMNVPLKPQGLAPYALLHFPTRQIPELADVLHTQ
ncbi:hypothetical protein E0L36_23490 [Streptomyces sp. AJS327]|uniref:hypothetical protein n=1 Tax=Streptomyces sp. AJS327 TaxID=2545265 RepID=UPI0015DEAEF7|nr:hypothetical protein [Streptomyces sp. AJS327]MBA0053718.1 hypothetical protein [Streptomyces sp. AJS327]